MKALVFWLLAALFAYSSAFEYIFWAKVNSTNLELSHEEFHLSRAMQKPANSKDYEYLCEIKTTPHKLPKNKKLILESAKSNTTAQAKLQFGDEELFSALLAHKAQLLDCAKKIQIRHRTSTKNLQARTKSYLSVLPFRFLSELAIDKSIIIYARKEQ